VISLHSHPYTSVPVDTWRTGWSVADYEEVTVDGRLTKKYSNLNFVGIETIANQIDITGMTHFHLHVWTPDNTLLKVKLVDFGPGGAFGGGDDTEHELLFPDLDQGEWVSLNLPLADFTGLQNRQNIAQLVLAGEPIGATTVYVDNVLFYNAGGTGVDESALSQSNIKVYPNPVVAGTQVRLDAQVKSVDVIDFSGRLISSTDASIIYTDNLNKGVYILRIHTLDGKIQNQKLIVQ
ncbi:MAG: T9SS type A sorting domain-containing protein, partial [Candidatus Moranbacteria bacterium]|nr:T9SS type A sorting domain-containing protein [Candidatus Moranbacteria bacterium]